MERGGRISRWMYRTGRPNRLAAALNRLGALAGSAGLWPSRLVTLEVRGRKSGRVFSFPLVLAEYEGERFLVSMFGKASNWVSARRSASLEQSPVSSNAVTD